MRGFGISGLLPQSGVKAGPEVARILKAVEAQWVAEGFPVKERVETILLEELQQE